MNISTMTMKLFTVYLVVMLVVIISSSAIPMPGEGENHNNQVKDNKLSDLEDMTPEEKKARLGIIVDKIDKNKDGEVTEEELKEWIQYVQNRSIMQDTERQWKEYDFKAEDGNRLVWESYVNNTYGYGDEPDNVDSSTYNIENQKERDKRRWDSADTDKDGVLSKEEFSNFLHPEYAEHMKDVVVEETIEDIDKDKDGFISVEEYIGDMYPNENGEEEPEWVKDERTQFEQFLDINKDGEMDNEEVKNWIYPPDYDHSNAEASHLIYEADDDKDKELTKEEILDHYDLFVGSQATDFGEALTKHDEF